MENFGDQLHRYIIHIDMDAFFAAIEQRDFPELRGQPVIVGGSPKQRGVVATCSYEARKFGIHSAMASSRAARKCPQGIFVKPRFEVYRSVSRSIKRIFFDFTELVEMASLDEAYLDVSATAENIDQANAIAVAIKRQIHSETQLTASAGVSINKSLAKIASDINKPAGIYVISEEQSEQFIKSLEISRFNGIGKVTTRRMHKMGVKTAYDLRRYSVDELVSHFGKAGIHYYNIVRGIDKRPVIVNRPSKSIGAEKTFIVDLTDKQQIREEISERSLRVARTLVNKGYSARTVTLKIKYSDFSQITRSHTLPKPLTGFKQMLATATTLIDKTDIGKRSIRLLGVSVSKLCRSNENTSTQTEKQRALEFFKH